MVVGFGKQRKHSEKVWWPTTARIGGWGVCCFIWGPYPEWRQRVGGEKAFGLPTCSPLCYDVVNGPLAEKNK